MTNKHTSGPWSINASSDGLIWIDGEFDTTNVCDLYHRHQDGDLIRKPNAEANARLIASAPDMYEALKRLLKWVEPIAGDNRDGVAEAEELASVEFARAALSKAEGAA